MPVHNGEAYLAAAMDALLSQDYDNFQLVLSDNASTDATGAICRAYSSRHANVRYTCTTATIPPWQNFRRVLDLSSGDYFMWAAHDDLWEPSYIRKCVTKLVSEPAAVLCASSLRFIDEEGRPLEADYEHSDNPDLSGMKVEQRVTTLAARHGWYAIYGLFRRNVLLSSRVLGRGWYGEDVALVMEACLRGLLVKVPEVLFYYRRYASRTEVDRAAAVGLVDRSSSVLSRKLALQLLTVVLRASLPAHDRVRASLALISVFRRDPVWRRRLRIPPMRL
jgi:glycosyltransferase involved in cell wall biosynthesis